MAHILAISIGPVQDFIAAARKTRDLWFGSSMLSELSRAVAKNLQEQNAELIFPPANCIGNGSSVANKIVAIVDGTDPAEAAAKARCAVEKALLLFRDEAVQRIRQRGVKSVDADGLQKQMTEQLGDFLEFYSAWWPVNGNYSEARLQADRLLAGRKALRNFAPAVSREGVPKSSLDGGRDALLDAGKLKDHERQKLGIRAGELLDGVSIVKRYAEPKRFVSVARVAIDPLVRRLKDQAPHVLEELNGLAQQLEEFDLAQRFSGFPQYQAFPYDTQLFYGVSLDGEVSGEEEKLASQFYETVRKACRELGTGDPSPYFAVIVADGDRMGALINAIEDKDTHKKLSESLAQFAADADRIVEEHSGAMIYSGGDDVLALLPLDAAFKCADALRLAFLEHVKGYACAGLSPSLSCGVSIAHYGEHLQNLLEWGRAAERSAKKRRNALSVHLHTRTAGEDCVTVTQSWGDNPVQSRWDKWTSLLMREALPVGATYELRRLVREFKGVSDISRASVLKSEVKRILGRKKIEGGKTPFNKEEAEKLADAFGETLNGLDDLVNELLIAKRIAGVMNIATQTGGKGK